MSSTTTRDRARADSAPPADAPGFTAKLVEAAQYVLIGGSRGPDITFRRGQEVAISEEVFEHLAEQFRLVTHTEPHRVVQERRRLFLLKDASGTALPRTIDETVRQRDGVDEPDPWAA